MTKEEIIIEIKKAIEKLRPYLISDGGDVEYVDYIDGIVYVRVHGACLGCEALDITLKDGVEEYLKSEFEEIVEVRLADESMYSDASEETVAE